MIIGNNLLKLALKVTGYQQVKYFAVRGRVVNDLGVYVTEYNPPIYIKGNWQPINTQYVAQMGLDTTKNYATWYDPNSATRDINRDTTGDKVIFCGTTYIALSSNDWSCVDGWEGMVFVEVPNE